MPRCSFDDEDWDPDEIEDGGECFDQPPSESENIPDDTEEMASLLELMEPAPPPSPLQLPQAHAVEAAHLPGVAPSQQAPLGATHAEPLLPIVLEDPVAKRRRLFQKTCVPHDRPTVAEIPNKFEVPSDEVDEFSDKKQRLEALHAFRIFVEKTSREPGGIWQAPESLGWAERRTWVRAQIKSISDKDKDHWLRQWILSPVDDEQKLQAKRLLRELKAKVRPAAKFAVKSTHVMFTYHSDAWVIDCPAVRRDPQMPFEEVTLLVRLLPAVKVLEKAFNDEMQTKADMLHLSNWTLSFELCPDVYRDKKEIRGHVHACMERPWQFQCKTLFPFTISGVLPQDAKGASVVTKARAKNSAPMHYYMQIPKKGHLFSITTFPAFQRFCVNPRWVTSLLAAGKISHDVAHKDIYISPYIYIYYLTILKSNLSFSIFG